MMRAIASNYRHLDCNQITRTIKVLENTINKKQWNSIRNIFRLRARESVSLYPAKASRVDH